MEQSPVLGPIFHARVIGKKDFSFCYKNFVFFIGLSSVLFLLDYLFIIAAYSHTIVRGASVQIVFGFEVKTKIVFFLLLSNFI
jgi:hypothetical protein